MRSWIPAVMLFVGTPSTGAEEPPPPQLSFTIRAITEVAPAVNALLQEIAEPTGAVFPQSADAAAQLSQRCGGYTPAIIREEASLKPGRKIVFYAPCAIFEQIRRELTPGSELGALAQSSGLRVLDWIKAKVTNSTGKILSNEGGVLPSKGYVTFDRTPVWTEITLKPGIIINRAQLINRFAKLLKCDGEGADVDACLDKRGLSVLNASAAVTPQATPSPAARPVDQILPVRGDERRRTPTHDLTTYRAMPIAMVYFAPAALPAAGSSTPAPAPVAAKQWPYDPTLIAATLGEAAKRGWIGDGVPTIVGVADVGLASSDGLPISPSVFSRNSRENGNVDDETGPEPNGIDNDTNTFVDDFHGAGQQRPSALQADGDLALCGSRTVGLADVGAALGATADHGSIVASIAAGVPLRMRFDGIRGLPKLVFYRLFPEACGAGAPTSASEGAVVAGLTYLYKRSSIAVLSFTLIGAQTGLDSNIRDLLANKDRLLILPAGNEQVGDIDANRPMPAYLGYSGSISDSWRRILVVGAARRDLSIADYSAWGVDTVRLYAPGEPVGAMGLNGTNIADPFTRGATSFAAPYVGMAAGMMRAQGMEDINAIRQRLMLATWPIQEPPEKVDVRHAGVLDLQKAAAVRFTSVELVEPTDGVLERRTVVGSFVTSKLGKALCASGLPLKLSSVQAIRLSDPKPGERTLVITLASPDASGLLSTDRRQCEPTGTFDFADVRGQTIRIDLTHVAAILFPWQPTD